MNPPRLVLIELVLCTLVAFVAFLLMIAPRCTPDAGTPGHVVTMPGC